MISSLKGVIDQRDGLYVSVDVSGVGYKVLVPTGVASGLPIGSNVKLFIHTHVRDDAIDLFGFLDIADLNLFEKLIGVSGIGPKTAISIFSVGKRANIIAAIVRGDADFFVGVPRLGRKNAQKIIIELRNKFGESGSELDLSQDGDLQNEIAIALRAFGFGQKEIQSALKGVSGKGETAQEKIKLALKYLGK